jgi:hypothetical protein
MKTIQTAEEFLLNKKDACYSHGDLKDKLFTDDVINYMIEFAKLHVEAALKAASEKATVTPVDHEEISEGSFRPIWGVDEDSILNAYPSTNIK